MHELNTFAAILILSLLLPACANLRPCAEPAGPLVLHYDFKKCTGASVFDSSGYGNHGILYGKPLLVRGLSGRALRFDGVDDYIRIPRNRSLEPGELTAAAWVKVNKFHPRFGLLIHKRNPSFHNNEAYDLQFWNNGTVRMVVANGDQSRLDSSARIDTGTWHHVAMVFSEPEMKLYLDGKLAGTKKHPRPLSHNPQSDLLIGATDHAQYPMDLFMACDLDDLRIFSSALSGSDVANLYAENADRIPRKPRPIPDSEEVDRKFPPWQAPSCIAPPKSDPADSLRAEMERLYRQGLRDKAASPEFLDAMGSILTRYRSGRLPFSENFDGITMPPGWEALQNVWIFEKGRAIQTRSWADTRFILSYSPGHDWQNYSFTFTAGSDGWFTPPARSSLRIYFRYQDRDNGYYLDLVNTGEITLSIRENGKERILRSAKTDYERVRNGLPWQITANGNTLMVFQQGKMIVQASDSTFPSGTIGLETIHSPGYFSDLAVDPL